MATVDVVINKPLYGTFCYIRETYVNKAIRENKMLKITIPQGTAIVDPNEWKATGKRMEQVFKIPTNPMVLWGNTVRIEPIA